MSLPKITDTEKGQYGVTLLPNVPTITANALKQKFEEKSDDLIIPKYNELIDDLVAPTGASELGAKVGLTETTVQGAIDSLGTGKQDTLTFDDVPTDGSVNPVKSNGIYDALAEKQDSATAVTHTQSTGVGSATKGTYVDSDGSVKAMTYEVNKTVPSDAKFSDTTYENKSAASGGTDVSLVTTGEKYTWNHKADTSDIPTTLAELGDDSTHRTVTDAEKTAWNAGGSPDAFKKVKVGATTITANGLDEIEFEASTGMTITADASNKKVSFSSTGGGGGGGDMLKSVYDTNNDGVVNKADEATTLTSLTASVAELNILDGVTASTTELNYVDGVTGAIQTQLNGKAASSHTHTVSDISDFPTIPTDLDDLTDVTITSPTTNDVLKYNGTGWENGAAPAGGHTMTPTPNASLAESDIVTAVNAGLTEGGINDDVLSAFGVGKWSNTMTKTYIVQGIAGSSTPIGTSGIGTWDTTGVDQTGWVTVPALVGASSNGNIDVNLLFDPSTVSVPIVLGGYIIDDTTGKMCIKFGNEIPDADTHTAKVGIEVTIKRTETTSVS